MKSHHHHRVEKFLYCMDAAVDLVHKKKFKGNIISLNNTLNFYNTLILLPLYLILIICFFFFHIKDASLFEYKSPHFIPYLIVTDEIDEIIID